jgi:tripartite ATP-independent transporter DctP family solute receptor
MTMPSAAPRLAARRWPGARLLSTQAREFRSTDIQPGDYPTVEAVRFMGELLAERSNGRLGVKVYPNGALGQERDMIEQVRLGGLDMMRINSAGLNNFVPETIVPVLPYIFRSREHMHAVVDGPIGDEILGAMERQGMVGLAFYDNGMRSIYSATRPIRTLGDVKGLKIRVQQSDLFVAVMQALGANPTPMPSGEVYTGLKTGIVDAAENNIPTYDSLRHFEAAKVLQPHRALDVARGAGVLQAGLGHAARGRPRAHPAGGEGLGPHMRRLWEEREVKARRTVEAGGAEIVPIADKQPFVDATRPVYAKFASTPGLQSLVQRIRPASRTPAYGLAA